MYVCDLRPTFISSDIFPPSLATLVEAERPLDEGNEWVVGRSTESVDSWAVAPSTESMDAWAAAPSTESVDFSLS